jgi:rhodanese-related sulfurtransferase
MLGILVVGLLALGAWTQLRPWLSVKGVTPQQLEHWRHQGPVVVADLRSQEEFNRGHVDGAVSVPWMRLRQQHHRWSPEDRVVLVCRTGYRSLQAVRFLHTRQFRDVHWLKGGMLGWAGHCAAGLDQTSARAHL